MHTSLDLVGLQVWRGALLLADFLLHSSLQGKETGINIQKSDHVIELGAGTGLTSVVAAMVANTVTSTGKLVYRSMVLETHVYECNQFNRHKERQYFILN